MIVVLATWFPMVQLPLVTANVRVTSALPPTFAWAVTSTVLPELALSTEFVASATISIVLTATWLSAT